MTVLTAEGRTPAKPRSFTLNALYLAILGTDLLLFGGWVAGLVLADPALLAADWPAQVIRAAGLACLAGACLILFAGPAVLRAIPWANLASATLLALLVVLYHAFLTWTGIGLLLALAVVDAEFAWFQFRALKRT